MLNTGKNLLILGSLGSSFSVAMWAQDREVNRLAKDIAGIISPENRMATKYKPLECLKETQKTVRNIVLLGVPPLGVGLLLNEVEKSMMENDTVVSRSFVQKFGKACMRAYPIFLIGMSAYYTTSCLRGAVDLGNKGVVNSYRE